MTSEHTVSRRTVLGTLGTTAAVATGVSTAGAATPERERSSPTTRNTVGAELTGFYRGTVDRIVDGEHVVVLVEADGSVVDQYVVQSEEYPWLSEGDAAYLFLLFGRLIAIWRLPGEWVAHS